MPPTGSDVSSSSAGSSSGEPTGHGGGLFSFGTRGAGVGAFAAVHASSSTTGGHGSGLKPDGGPPTSSKVAMEVDGHHHFCVLDSRRQTGGTTLRNALLWHAGWQVAPVHLKDWSTDEKESVTLLEKLLRGSVNKVTEQYG